MKTYNLNVASILTVPFTIWLAATGRIEWWTFFAIWAAQFSVTMTFKGK